MATNNSVKIKITGDSSDLKKELSSLGKDVRNFGTSASAIFKGIMASQIVTKGFSMLSSGLKSAINTGMNFEAQMSRVQAIAGATNEELDTLTAKAKELGQTSVFTAQEAAEGMENLASAGFEVQEIMDAMPGMLNLAASSGEDLASSAETTASILRAFGLDASEAGHVADVLATNAAKTNAAVADTGEAMKYVAPMANTMGLSMEECAAAIGILSDSGIKGSQAGTTLRSALSRLAKPTSAMQSVMKELGLEFYDSEGKMKSLSELVAMLQSSLSGLTQEEQQNALVTLFGQEAMSGMMVLMNSGSEKLSSLTQSYQECTGSAEEMANTMIDNLSGDVKLLESAFEALQITASESTNGMARSVVQMGTDLLTALNEAGKTGGLSGIADAFIEQIPELLPKITKGIESVISGIGKKLPALAKGLVAQLPTVLKSVTTLIPQLTSVFYEVASGVVEGLVSQLPELVPILSEGILGMLTSIGTGIVDVMGGLEKGMRKALLSLGLVEPTAEEAWESLVNTVDNTKALEIAGEVEANYTVETEITVEDIKEKVEGAKSEIEGQLEGVEGIDASKIAEKIIAGNSADVLGDVLKAVGIDGDKVDEVVGTIEDAQGSIQSAIDNLGLTDDQETTIQQMIENGATSNQISEYLMKTCGVDPTEASKVVETITTAQTDISDAIKSLDMETVISENLTSMVEGGASTNEITEYLMNFNVDEQTALDIAESITTGGEDVSSAISGLGLGVTASTWLASAAASGDKTMLAAALQMLGLDDVDISGVLASYDTVKGTITAGIASIFTDIEDTLTDGKADTPDKMNGLKEQVEGWAEDAYNQISKWYSDKLAELEKNKKEGSISEETYKQLVQDATDKYDALTQSVNANAEATVAFIEDCAGKTTEYCAGRMEELGILKDEAYNLAAQIDALSLSSQQMSEYSVSRTLTINGRTSDQTTQLEALKLTAAEYEQAKADADQAYAEAVAALQQQYTNGEITEEEYSASESEAAERLAEAYKTAGDAYNEMMTAVIEGIAKANPEFAAQLKKLQSLQQTTDIVENIKNQIANGQNGDKSITAESIIKGLGMDADTLAQQLNEQLGTEFNGDTLTKAISDSLKSDPGSDPFAEYWTTLSQDLNTDMTEAMQSLGGEEGFAATLQAATSQGWLAAVNGIDWADLSTQLQTAMNAGMAGYEYTLTVKPEVPEGLDTEGANEEKISAKKSAVVQAGAAEVTVDESVNEQVTEAVQEEVAEAEPAEVEPQITVADTVADLNTQIANALSSGEMLTAQELMDKMGIDPAELVAQINEQLGTDLDVDTFMQNISYALSGVDNSAMVDLASNLSTTINSAVNSADVDMSGLADEVESETSKVADAADIEDEIGDIFKNVGKAADSMNPELRSAVNTAISIVNSLPLALRKFLGIASPSRVMKEIGKFTGEGFGGGLEESLSNAVQTARSLMGDLTSATSINIRPSISSSDLNGSINDAFAGLADIETNRDIAMYVNGREFARATTKDYNSALNGYAKRIGLGYGRG